MKYYRKLEVPKLGEIISYARKYILGNESVFQRKAGVNLIHLDPSFVLGSEEIQYCLREYDLICVGAFAFVMYHDNQCSIHSDSFIHDTRLNIPVMNCEGTLTKFYDVPEWKIAHNVQGYEVKVAADPDKCIELAKVEIDRPTLLRVNTPHRVIVNKIPRITISLYFNTDPTFILETEND